MKLVFIHGISQEELSAEQLLEIWARMIDPDVLAKFDARMAYYGQELASWTNGDAKSAVAMGVSGAAFDVANNDEVNFLVRALEQAAIERDLGDDDIQKGEREAANSGAEAAPMDTWLGRRLVGLVRAIEALSPAKGAIALRVIKQAYTYLAAPGAGAAVDDLVKPFLKEGPLVIISHSLGTVVAFKILRELEAAGKPLEVPLLITMGSPLGLDAVKARLGPPRKKPGNVRRWINFYDPSDFVALGKDLDHTIFSAGIENVGDVDNPTPNAHGITGYLSDRRVIDALKSI
jgi:hypothetical protein